MQKVLQRLGEARWLNGDWRGKNALSLLCFPSRPHALSSFISPDEVPEAAAIQARAFYEAALASSGRPAPSSSSTNSST